MTDPRIQAMIDLAVSQVGYHEGRSGGHWNNHNKYAPTMPDLAWSQNQPWCAVFVAWLADQCGLRDFYPRTASVPVAAKWGRDRHQFSDYPAVGAQVIIGNKAHTGFVIDFDDDYITTVEGNTNTSGSAEGDGVYQKRRPRRSASVYGYVYPNIPGVRLESADPAYNAAHPAPAPTPTPAPAPQEESVTYPANILDLRPWKLQTLGKDIKHPDLDTYSSNRFEVQGGGVAFRAFCGDATTPNSHYPRTELREISPVEWDSADGVHALSGEALIGALPPNHPEAVMAQFHDATDDQFMLRFVGVKPSDGGRITVARVFAEWGEGKGQGSEKDPLGTIRLGDRFRFQVIADEWGMRVYWRPTDSSHVTNSKREGRHAEGCYAKAGIYNQSNTSYDKATAFAGGIIYKLGMRHAA